ncbi:hypothetical protein JM79_2740 [Gramella sp. Hel_I_59]|uniref:hypothetical protein n=1 Tax=Gramella sp. Hel_I_59 TaxID=1249978 RepID=UPI00115032FB|nr:hypothetical protein [Gramella sp. Hel_I_59]TQI71791.1 hypothetical protein JM79_2740 [Gramella sp. Hel_I_59]
MEKVYQIIQANSKKTGNASGIQFIRAWDESKMNLQEFVQHLDQLIKDQKVYMREGINHSLLFAI